MLTIAKILILIWESIRLKSRLEETFEIVFPYENVVKLIILKF